METNCFQRVLKLTLVLCFFLSHSAAAVNYRLNVSAVGSGSVTKNPTNSTYPSGATVTVTATPSNGWYFSHWSGDTNGSVNPLNVVIKHNLSIDGNFLAYPVYSVTLTTNGQGSVTLNPAGGSYQSNSIVTATATPANAWVFTGWTGGTNSGTNPLSFPVNSDLGLTANFAQLPAFDVTPVSVTNALGSTVSFSAHAVGPAPIQYRWYFSGGSLDDATNSTLALTNVTLGQTGNYWVMAMNNNGSVTSSVVSLVLANVGGSSNVVNFAHEASLRAAIAKGGWVTLAFNATITLTNTINITNDVILDAPGVTAIISGGNAVGLFNVAPGASFSATNLSLVNGYVSADSAEGGAIFNDGGTVILVSCTVTNNSVVSLGPNVNAASGGAIFTQNGALLLLNSSISDNRVTNAGFGINPGQLCGGAIYNNGSLVKLVACNLSGNSCYGGDGGWPALGGAVYQAAGSLLATNSLLAFNVATGAQGIYPSGRPGPGLGGAFYAAGGIVAIDHCQFLTNGAYGGPTVRYFTGAGFGGAIYSAATMTAESSTFSGNQALSSDGSLQQPTDGQGGAIYNSGSAILDRCAIYFNSVSGSKPYSS
jgi:hypothetical protein